MKNKIEKELLDILKNIVNIDTCYPPGSSKLFSNYVKKYLNKFLDLENTDSLNRIQQVSLYWFTCLVG